MTNTVTPISQDENRLEAASRWVLKIDEGLSSSDKARLKAWLAEEPRHTALLLEVAEAWDKVDSLSRLAEVFPLSNNGLASTRPAVSARSRVLAPRVWAAAASVVIAITAGLVAFTDVTLPGLERSRAPVALAATYETAIGEQKTVLLPDGTEVVLNTDSALRVAYARDARVLNLLRGELHVDVAEDPARPLSVIAGNKIVQALGTEFSVQITDEQHVEVLVTEGKVVVGVQPARIRSVEEETPGSVFVPPVLAQTNSNTVDAGEALVLGVPDEIVTPVTADQIEVELSWKEGRLIFRSEPLAEALAEVERYTTVEFVLLDDELKSETLSGRFRAGDVDTLLALLEANFQIGHEFDGDDRVLLSSL